MDPIAEASGVPTQETHVPNDIERFFSLDTTHLIRIQDGLEMIKDSMPLSTRTYSIYKYADSVELIITAQSLRPLIEKAINQHGQISEEDVRPYSAQILEVLHLLNRSALGDKLTHGKGFMRDELSNIDSAGCLTGAVLWGLTALVLSRMTDSPYFAALCAGPIVSVSGFAGFNIIASAHIRRRIPSVVVQNAPEAVDFLLHSGKVEGFMPPDTIRIDIETKCKALLDDVKTAYERRGSDGVMEVIRQEAEKLGATDAGDSIPDNIVMLFPEIYEAIAILADIPLEDDPVLESLKQDADRNGRRMAEEWGGLKGYDIKKLSLGIRKTARGTRRLLEDYGNAS